MKLFSDNRFFKNKTYLSLALLILLQSCATYHTQFGNKAKKATNSATDTSKLPILSF
jgi:hypothetical protein